MESSGEETIERRKKRARQQMLSQAVEATMSKMGSQLGNSDNLLSPKKP